MAHRALQRSVSPTSGPVEALGESDLFLEFQQRVARVATIHRPVLLIGERGTGKELAAARIHFLSPRWAGPFLKLNCAALTPDLLETELFGHEPGAFTGAFRRRIGRFEAANGGTLFLDEIAQMPVPLQEKILRVVEYGTFERVGSSEPITVDARLVGATNANLEALAGKGKFKRDLLDRLSFDVLFVPPLRLRQGDIELLAAHFAAQMALEIGLPATPTFSSRALQTLREHSWPGNVRELRNVVERAVYRAEKAVIDNIELNPFTSPFPICWDLQESDTDRDHARPMKHTAPTPAPDLAAQRTESRDLSFSDAVVTLELELLRKALKSSKYNQRDAANRLGLTYDQFRGLYRKYQPQLEQSF
jgi:psp operon transcriptional activator